MFGFPNCKIFDIQAGLKTINVQKLVSELYISLFV